MNSISPQDCLRLVVRPVLNILEAGGEKAERLMMETAAQESGFVDRPQIDGGALGLWQMEEATHNYLWANYLVNHFILAHRVRGLLSINQRPTFGQLLISIPYSCAMGRIKYLSCPGEIPSSVAERAAYYKKYYNTPKGKATEEEYINNYDLMLKPLEGQLWPKGV